MGPLNVQIFFFLVKFSYSLKYQSGSLGGSDSKEYACSAGEPGLIPELGRSLGEGNGNLPQCSCLEKPRDGSLAGYSLRGGKQSDTTERLTLSGSLFSFSLGTPIIQMCFLFDYLLFPLLSSDPF